MATAFCCSRIHSLSSATILTDNSYSTLDCLGYIFFPFAIFAQGSKKREASALRLVPQGLLEELTVSVQPNDWVDRELELSKGSDCSI
jgi:hypothetical protein